MSYATPKEVGVAMNLQYTLTQDSHSGSKFRKGNRHIWAIREGWQTAELIDGRYTNHRKFEHLIDALRREL